MKKRQPNKKGKSKYPSLRSSPRGLIQVEGFDDSLQREVGDAEVFHRRLGGKMEEPVERPSPDPFNLDGPVGHPPDETDFEE